MVTNGPGTINEIIFYRIGALVSGVLLPLFYYLNMSHDSKEV